MSWIQRLYDTYEQCVDLPQFASDPPPPKAHTTHKAHIEIVIDGHGLFRRATVVSTEDCTTPVPCTEASAARTGKRPVSHPLCDKLQYLAGDFVGVGGTVTTGFLKDPEEPFRTYVGDLAAWQKSPHGHSKVKAILTYVEKGHVVRDLVRAGVLPIDERGGLLKEWKGSKNAKPPIFRVVKNPEQSFVRWRVEIPGEIGSGTWEDRTLVDSWIAYYAGQQTKRGICMVTGEDAILAEQHPSKIRDAGDKAKLISSNDTSGYTFRGRFADADEACSVGFEVSQKAHNALRWLIRRQAHRNGDQVTVTWAVGGKPVPDPYQDSAALFRDADELLPRAIETTEELIVGDVGQAFAGRLNRAIAGYRARLDATDDVLVMVVDSATRGRLAIPFYRELTGSEFLDRVAKWHERYAWPQDYGKGATTKRRLPVAGAPSPRDIADAAFGPPRKADKKRSLQKATVERLLPCIVDGRPLPRDLVESAVRRTCNRVAFGKDERGEWEKNLGVACALFKGFFETRKYEMTLEADRTTRDYLYGRLLALAERIERVALIVADENRDTNASRLMQRFADRPFSTWPSIEKALIPYKARLRVNRPGFLYNMERRVDEVMNAFRPDDFLDDRRLSGEFLLGYHCERAFKAAEAVPPAFIDVADTEAIQRDIS